MVCCSLFKALACSYPYTGLLQTQPDIVSALNNATNVTLLAPNNDALNKFLNNSAVTVEMAQNPGLLIALLNYHVLDGVYYVSNFTNSSTFIPTMLTNETYANITGGQRVQALLENGTTTFYTWLKENSSVVTPVCTPLTGYGSVAKSFLECQLYRWNYPNRRQCSQCSPRRQSDSVRVQPNRRCRRHRGQQP